MACGPPGDPTGLAGRTRVWVLRARLLGGEAGLPSSLICLRWFGGANKDRDASAAPPVSCSRVPLPKMSLLSGVLVGTTIVSTTDQLSSVRTSAAASATCHSAKGETRPCSELLPARRGSRAGWEGGSVLPARPCTESLMLGVPALTLKVQKPAPQPLAL